MRDHRLAPIEELNVEVVRKNIKNMYLRVDPDTGAIRVSAPQRLPAAEIRRFILARREWIEIRRRRAQGRARQPELMFRSGEEHLLWGAGYRLEVTERQGVPRVDIGEGAIRLAVRPGADVDKRRDVMEAWYRDQVRQAAGPLIEQWQGVMGVRVSRLFVRRMKTLWGSCHHAAGSIRLNTELARRPTDCFEYVVVHELAHLIEPSHNARFWGLMDTFLPDWRERRDLLNRGASAPSLP